MKEWYQCTGKEVLDDLQVTDAGLTGSQVTERRRRFGENQLIESKKYPAWKVFLKQFQDLLVLILIGAAVISMLTDNMESTVVIFAVITLNAILGTIQHQKAQKSLESLKALSAPMATVLRDKRETQIPSREVVPGDILFLEAGDLVVADGRILEAAALYINESSLTGESLAVWKTEKPVERTVSLADRSNMVYSGSLVTSGRGSIVVTATGMNTELGKIASMMNDTKEKKTPLQVSLDEFSSRLAAAIMVICLVVFLLSLYRKMPVLDSLMFAVALAVAAIPEALGSIVTIVQAMGTQKMAREQAIIKDLKAVESLGCVSVICTDKTGTLTQNRMSVEKITLDGETIEWQQLKVAKPRHKTFLEVCALVNDAVPGMESWKEKEREDTDAEGVRTKETRGEEAGAEGTRTEGIGDATELALIELICERGLSPEGIRNRYPRVREIPFDSDRKMMSTIHRISWTGNWKGMNAGAENCDRILLTKGAVDILLERCRRIAEKGNVRSITSEDRRRIMEQNQIYSRKGLRVLALTFRPLRREEALLPAEKLERDYVFLGMAAMMDPPRPETKTAVQDAKRAGIVPVMITGDHKVTAMAIAEQVGIRKPDDQAVTGAELNAMKEEDLEKNLEQITVYARVSPENKLRIVRAWQKKGNIVAMTGDGVNDAPALKQADIGIAMGKNGTEVSKDAAAMILADDNFATIIKAVANGRNVYRNIRNAIGFLLSGNMAGIFCVLYTTILALPVPFAPVHLLFINLLTDSLPAIAIGMEQPEKRLLNVPPRNPKKGILTLGFIGEIMIQGLLIAVCTMYAYRIGLAESPALASTMAFSTLTLARLFHGFNCRSVYPVLKIGVFSNLYTVMAFEAGVLLLAAALFVPGLQILFSAADLSRQQLVCVCFSAFFPTIIIQTGKMLRYIFTCLWRKERL
ncbi:MAG: cation-translocating P-type ATPase [Hungatella sp.]|nr:cation-translocating P-type ATPase [Hungatella sp.]